MYCLECGAYAGNTNYKGKVCPKCGSELLDKYRNERDLINTRSTA